MKGKKLETQLFTLQTQIRAQLNLLRKTYNQISHQRIKPERKHYHQRLYTQTLTPPSAVKKESIHEYKERKHMSPLTTSRKMHYQRKHFPSKYNDHVTIQENYKLKKSAYLKNPQPSKSSSKGLNFGNGHTNQKLCKKFDQSKHSYDNNFFR